MNGIYKETDNLIMIDYATFEQIDHDNNHSFPFKYCEQLDMELPVWRDKFVLRSNSESYFDKIIKELNI